MAGKVGRRLDKGWSVAKGAKPPLLGEQLLVGNRVREAEGWTVRTKKKLT